MSHGTGSLDRGENYNYFFVTQQQDFPSVLIECGFVTNYTEAMALANPTHQNGIASAIVQGASDFLARCDYSCYGEGSGSFTNSGSYDSTPTESSTSENTAEEVPSETTPSETPEETASNIGFEYNPFSDPYNSYY